MALRGRLGSAPTSKHLVSLLEESPIADQVLFDESGRLGEETSNSRLALVGDPATTFADVLKRLPEPAGGPTTRWSAQWEALERAAWATQEPELGRRGFEGALAAQVARQLPANALLFVSNSLPVRDLDRFARSRSAPLRALANRGASGIDGILSTAFGAGYGLQKRLVLLVGDLAFLHDLNALAAVKRLGLRADIIVINNDGGGIFEFLPVARHEPPFTELFVTPHGIQASTLAQAFGMDHARIELRRGPPSGLVAAVPDAPSRLVEIVSDRKENVRHRREVDALVAAAIDRVPLEVSHAR